MIYDYVSFYRFSFFENMSLSYGTLFVPGCDFSVSVRLHWIDLPSVLSVDPERETGRRSEDVYGGNRIGLVFRFPFPQELYQLYQMCPVGGSLLSSQLFPPYLDLLVCFMCRVVQIVVTGEE